MTKLCQPLYPQELMALFAEYKSNIHEVVASGLSAGGIWESSFKSLIYEGVTRGCESSGELARPP